MYVCIYLLIFMFINIEFKIHIFYKSKYQPKYMYQYISLNNIFLYKKIQIFYFIFSIFLLYRLKHQYQTKYPKYAMYKAVQPSIFFPPNKFQRITSRGRATLPLGGAMAPAKKKKSPPAYILILIGPPNDVHLAPPPISVQYLNSLPGSSFSCRPFYPLIKQNMAPLYLNTQRHYPTK